MPEGPAYLLLRGERPCRSGVVRRAIVQIAAADISMSLDNVLAVCGRCHASLVCAGDRSGAVDGLMGMAAGMVAKLLHRHPWISYAGIFIVSVRGGAHDLDRLHDDHARRLTIVSEAQQNCRRIVALFEARKIASFGVGLLDCAQLLTERLKTFIVRRGDNPGPS